MLKKSLIAYAEPKANDSQIFTGYGLRITFITPRLIRVEKADHATDLMSFAVWNRRFNAGNMTVSRQNGNVTAETDDVVFTIKDGKPYSVYFKDSKKTEVFSKQKNLKGTCRTLDQTEGAIDLEDGFITKGGAYLFDDSASMLIDENGRFAARDKNAVDYYAFAYGNDYRATINAFYLISSSTPIIPRFALGVWWSRYHAYTQKEYLDLMDRFENEGVPLTVATVDMDWHWVHGLDKRFGVNYGGWTGYSWNTELFPDYKAFLRALKKKDLHVTVNLHPADGVQFYEDMYEQMAKANGVDPATKQTVKFQCGNDDFWNSYFDILHKPYEKDGVDFWWIDWQQGDKSDVDGLDPLNALNHYHYLDNAENGEIPLILSRYAGAGSHRYPLGFSGDTAMNWDCLDFQPYFTATAANAAYGWWSHDIGGHHRGYRDDDLYMRWIEFGVFSPIMRLHSSTAEILGKEPWKYRSDVYHATKRWLRFRHKLIPYIFTMDHRTHDEGIALCEPMYYSYPDDKRAYKVPNQYMFGSELMVCPITTRQDKKINYGKVKAFIPEGRWTDIFTNQSYEGSGEITLLREIDTIPVLAREGAIIPLSADDGNRTDNPTSFEIWVFSGNGSFDMVEDNGKTNFADHKAVTRFETTFNGNRVTFTVSAVQGDLSVIPQKRNYKILFKDIIKDGKPLCIEINGAEITKSHTVSAGNALRAEKENLREGVIRIFSRWQGNTAIRCDAYYGNFDGKESEEDIRAGVEQARIPKVIKQAITELLETK